MNTKGFKANLDTMRPQRGCGPGRAAWQRPLRGHTDIWMLMAVWVVPGSALAYIGPGTGLSAIGALLAVVLGVIVALFGFVWYPVKRLLRRKKTRDSQQDPS